MLKTSIDRLERLEQERRPHHVSVLRWQPGRDDPDVLYDQHVAAGLVRDGFGVLVVPSSAETDELFDLAVARGDFHGGRPQATVTSATVTSATETVGNAEPETPVAPVDDWQAALDELARRPAARDRYEGGKADRSREADQSGFILSGFAGEAEATYTVGVPTH